MLNVIISSSKSTAGMIGSFAGLIISGCFVVIYLIVGIFLFKSARRNIEKAPNNQEKENNQIPKKSISAIIYPWIILILPFFYIATMNKSSGAPGFVFIYYIGLYVPIVFPLALISTISKRKNIYITCNAIATLPIAYVFLVITLVQQRGSSEEIKRVHYDLLSKEFRKEKEILDIKYFCVLLEGNLRVKLDALRGLEPELDDFVKDLLIGKRGKIVMPDFEKFERNYIVSLDPFPGLTRKDMPRDPRFGEYFAPVPADIIIDGESVTEKIKEEKRRWQTIWNERYLERKAKEREEIRRGYESQLNQDTD
jgi:hypothetical protein